MLYFAKGIKGSVKDGPENIQLSFPAHDILLWHTQHLYQNSNSYNTPVNLQAFQFA